MTASTVSVKRHRSLLWWVGAIFTFVIGSLILMHLLVYGLRGVWHTFAYFSHEEQHMKANADKSISPGTDDGTDQKEEKAGPVTYLTHEHIVIPALATQPVVVNISFQSTPTSANSEMAEREVGIQAVQNEDAEVPGGTGEEVGTETYNLLLLYPDGEPMKFMSGIQKESLINENGAIRTIKTEKGAIVPPGRVLYPVLTGHNVADGHVVTLLPGTSVPSGQILMEIPADHVFLGSSPGELYVVLQVENGGVEFRKFNSAIFSTEPQRIVWKEQEAVSRDAVLKPERYCPVNE